MRISDWSSDVCSSDLENDSDGRQAQHRRDGEANSWFPQGLLGNRAQALLICGVDPSIAVRVGSWGNRQARLRRKLGTGIDDRDTPGTAQAFLRPCRLSVVGEMIEPGQRAGVDGKAQRLFRRHRKGVRKGGADRAAVADADDVAPRMLPGESLDGGGDAPAEGGEALAAGRNLRRRGKPEVAPRLAVFGRERPRSEEPTSE